MEEMATLFLEIVVSRIEALAGADSLGSSVRYQRAA